MEEARLAKHTGVRVPDLSPLTEFYCYFRITLLRCFFFLFIFFLFINICLFRAFRGEESARVIVRFEFAGATITDRTSMYPESVSNVLEIDRDESGGE